MNTTFFPDGMLFPIGALTVMVVGRREAWLTTCCAAARFVLTLLLLAPPPALLLFELLVVPQAAAAIAITAMAATTPAARRTRLSAGVNGDMTLLLLGVGLMVKVLRGCTGA